MNKPELLAPAGNEKCVYAAVQSGADSIYLGLKNFGARSYAENFDGDSLKNITDYCHLRGVKVYVTLNTLIADIELPEALESARFAANIGVDGVIVQDLGLISLIHEHFPDFPVHISTQSTVMNCSAMDFAADIGAVRAVLARELNFEEICSIVEKSNIETEIFVHGAQCYCYSGQCLMSSVYGGRSGNRGKCAGPCRLPYSLKNSDGKVVDKGYILSPVDMCLGKAMDKVLETGAACLKIEGRMKGPEYVAASCEIYRAALDSEKNISTNEMDILENTFSRGGFTSGLFEGKSNRMKKDRSNDDAYTNQHEKLLEPYRAMSRKECNIKKSGVVLEFLGRPGEKARLVLTHDAGKFFAYSEMQAQKATGAPVTAERIVKQLEKLGDYPFFAEKTSVDVTEDFFIPMGEINAMRRSVAQQLSECIAESFRRNYKKTAMPKHVTGKMEKRFFTASVLSIEQAEILGELPGIKEIYLPAHLCECYMNEKTIPAFPAIVREKHLEKYKSILQCLYKKGVRKVLVSEWGMLKEAAEYGMEIVISADMNVFNSESAKVLKKIGATRIMLSPEMNIKQLGFMDACAEYEVAGYGRLPLMKTANCPLKGNSCGKNRKDCMLQDRKGENIPVVCNCSDCTAFLFNSKPVYMGDKLFQIPGNISGINLFFTVETPEECKRIFEKYSAGEKPEGEFTRGHFFRGVL